MKLFPGGGSSSLPQIKWIYGFTQGDRLRYLVMTLCDCFNAVSYSIYALISRDLIDAAISYDRPGLISNAVKLLALLLSRIVVNQYSSWLTADLIKRWEVRIRQSAFESILKKDEKAVNRFHSGALLDMIFTDANRVADSAVNSITDLASMIAGLAAALVSLFWLNAALPCVIVAAGLAFVFLRRLFKNKIKDNYMRSRQAAGECKSYYQEALENLLIFRIFRAGAAAHNRAKAFDKRSYEVWRVAKRYNTLLSVGMRSFFSLGELFAMVACAFLMMWGKLSYGSLTAMLQLIAQLQSPFAWVFDQVSSFTAMTASAQRLMEVEQLPESELPDQLDAVKTYENLLRVRFDGVSFAYENGRSVFDGVTVKLEKGEFVMITGASGIGKSTLLKILLAVYAPDAGRVVLEMNDGRRIPADSAARSLFAYVPQGNMLFSGTIRDNLTFLCGERDDESINRALRLARADAFVTQTPRGLDTVLEEGGRGLSEGQSQRLAIARALLSNAPILLLDEATSALDGNLEREILQNLRSLDARTVLIISHRQAAMEICDKIWHIEGGKLYESGPNK